MRLKQKDTRVSFEFVAAALMMLIAFSACEREGDTPPPKPATAVAPSGQRGMPRPLAAQSTTLSATASAGISNSIIDLTVAAAEEPQTDSEIFDESEIFSPNFALNQNDPSLSDLFSPSGESELCVPTSIAQSLIYLFAYHAPVFNSLKLGGLSSDGKSIDPNQLIRQMAGLCKTDPNSGTNDSNAISCVTTVLTQSGYGFGDTQLISPFNQDSSLPILTREVSILDIRSALKQRVPVMIEAAWFSFDQTTKAWTRTNGHYVTAFGYDYNQSWGEDQIQLKIINPENHYDGSRKFSLYDTIMIERVSPQPGVTYPVHRPFILTGAGFGGTEKRGFLGMILTVAPALVPPPAN